jgi:hypothetical protein
MAVEYLLHESSVGYAVSYIEDPLEEGKLTGLGVQSADARRHYWSKIEGVSEEVAGSRDVRFVHFEASHNSIPLMLE